MIRWISKILRENGQLLALEELSKESVALLGDRKQEYIRSKKIEIPFVSRYRQVYDVKSFSCY